MSNKFSWFFLIVFVCLAGCQKVEVTVEFELEPTPFVESLASLTPTTEAKTATPVPTATPTYTGPIIASLEGQTISDGGQFSPVSLDEYILDEDHHPDEIIWNQSGENDLNVRITRRVLIVSPPNSSWTGSETIHLEACDPDEQCATMQLEYAVEFVNDAPIVTKIDDQLIFPGEKFSEIVLDDYIDDTDNPDEDIDWSYSGNSGLDIQIDERVVSVAPLDDAWRGPETIQFTACDSNELCDRSDVVFMVQEPDDLKVTFVANAGFLIEVGDKKVAIDALLRPWGGYQSLSVADVSRMENARWPFDAIDLIVVTHDHFDHYAVEVLFTYLENNPGSAALSTQGVEENLRMIAENDENLLDRMIGRKIRAGESSRIIVNGIGVELMNFPHGPGAPENLGVIISIGGFRVLHTGDLDPEQTLEVLAQ